MKPKKILFVEDDPFIRDIYLTKLKELGFEAKGVENAEKTFELVKNFKPDLLLLDIILPDLDGWELLRRLREEKLIEKAKVVVLSNLEQKTEADKSEALGVEKFFIKANYTPTEVADYLKKILS
jgi:DNA-binding response OmpR family regulator